MDPSHVNIRYTLASIATLLGTSNYLNAIGCSNASFNKSYLADVTPYPQPNIQYTGNVITINFPLTSVPDIVPGSESTGGQMFRTTFYYPSGCFNSDAKVALADGT